MNLAPFLNDFFNEIAQHILKTAIITISTSDGFSQAWDVNKSPQKNLSFGIEKEYTAIFYARIARLLGEFKSVGIILRSFTEQKDAETGLPIKELRGYYLILKHNRLICHKISKTDLFKACITDAKTGEKLEPEEAVEYCE